MKIRTRTESRRAENSKCIMKGSAMPKNSPNPILVLNRDCTR